MNISADLTSLPDERLLALFAESADALAFRELFNRYYTPLAVFANRFLADTDAASDVVQNLFVAIYERKADVTSVASLRSFLYGAVRNACLNVIKHEKVKRNHEAETLFLSNEADAPEADELVRQSEAEARIAAALAQLPAQCGRIFTLSRFEGLSNQQIADQLAISKRTVETQISNALKTLRVLLLGAEALVAFVVCLPF